MRNNISIMLLKSLFLSFAFALKKRYNALKINTPKRILEIHLKDLPTGNSPVGKTNCSGA